jgi:hypothetical protein
MVLQPARPCFRAFYGGLALAHVPRVLDCGTQPPTPLTVPLKRPRQRPRVHEHHTAGADGLISPRPRCVLRPVELALALEHVCKLAIVAGRPAFMLCSPVHRTLLRYRELPRNQRNTHCSKCNWRTGVAAHTSTCAATADTRCIRDEARTPVVLARPLHLRVRCISALSHAPQNFRGPQSSPALISRRAKQRWRRI